MIATRPLIILATTALFSAALTAQPRSASAANPPVSRRVIKETIPWSGLAGQVEGRSVYVGAADGSVIFGKVAVVEAGRIVFADKRLAPMERQKVRFVQYDKMQGKARAGWTTSLLLAGAGASVLLGAREVFGENASEGFWPAAIGLSAGGGASGYAIGRSRDRMTVILTFPHE
ncbi:MAG: hypothetical protein ACK6DZ_13550 [Acidobacteriota bacterium]